MPELPLDNKLHRRNQLLKRWEVSREDGWFVVQFTMKTLTVDIFIPEHYP